jgi:hypothetical protein
MSLSSSTWYNPQILPTNEQPTGVIDGVNRVFTLAWPPVPSSLALYLNGMYLTPKVDYVLVESGGVITMATALSGADKLRACYLH